MAIGMKSQGGALPSFADMCQALQDETEESWRATRANARLAQSTKTATPFQLAVLAMMPELKEALCEKWEAQSCIVQASNVAGSFKTHVSMEGKALVGYSWDAERHCLDALSLEEHHHSADCLRKTCVLAGAPRGGKSTVAKLLAKGYCVDVSSDIFVFSKAIDPLGILTRNGTMRKVGAYVLTDCDMESRLNSSLGEESLKSLVDVAEGGMIPARYANVQFEPCRPHILAINADAEGVGWPTKQHVPFVAALIRKDTEYLAAADPDVQAMASRVRVFFYGPGIGLLTQAAKDDMRDVTEAMMAERLARRAAVLG